MKRLLGCVLVLGCFLTAGERLSAQSLQSTLLALKNPSAPRKALSVQLVDQMMAQARRNQAPARTSVQRFTEELTNALLGKDITTVRANALQKSLADLMRGKGSTFVPASTLRETLTGCGVDEPAIDLIVKRFIEIGQEVRGPDDLPVMKPFLK